jgi:hypothetical protein
MEYIVILRSNGSLGRGKPPNTLRAGGVEKEEEEEEEEDMEQFSSKLRDDIWAVDMGY